MRSRSDEVEAFFTQHARRLERFVAAKVTAPQDTIEDACSFAWLQLARRPDIDLSGDRAFGWLYRIGIREAWRLTAVERVTVSLMTPCDGCEPTIGHEPMSRESVDDVVAARCRLDALAALSERERRILLLFAFGFSYAEIAKRTGDTVRTVDRQLRRATQRLRASASTAIPPSERAVLERLAAGATSEAAARDLGISPQTVDEHAQSACRRLGVATRAAAIALLGGS